MSFEPSKIEEFLANFETVKEKIRNFKGCNFLELYRDQNNTNIFFTYSYWNTEANLNYLKMFGVKQSLCLMRNPKHGVWIN